MIFLWEARRGAGGRRARSVALVARNDVVFE